MPRRSGKIYRDLGLTPENNKWIEEQAGGQKKASDIVNKCIAMTRRKADAMDRIDVVADEVARLSGALNHANERLARLTAFLEFQTWVAVGRDTPRFDAWLDEFEQFSKEDADTHAHQ
jgi:hypothetical protein